MAGPSHVDLSVLWVPIMPETSKLGPAMEEAGKGATESFDKGTSGLGDKIHDSFTKATGKVKDVFHKAGNDASESMADGVKEQSSKVEEALQDTGKKAHSKFRDALGDVGKEMVGAISPDIKRQLSERVEDVVGGAFKTAFGDEGVAGMVGGALSKAAGQGFETWIDSLKDKVTGVKDAANNTRQAFASFKDGDTTGGVSKLVDSFGKLGIEVKDLPQPLQDAFGKLDEAKATAQGFADIFKDMPGVIGKVGDALEKMIIPISAGLMSIQALNQGLQNTGAGAIVDPKNQGSNYSQTLANLGNQIPGVHMHVPGSAGPSGVDLSDVTGLGRGGDVLGSGADAYDAFSSGLPVSGPGAIAAPAAPTAAPAAALPSFADSVPSSASSPAELHASGGKVANLYKVAQSLQGTPYSQALRNDCSGMVSKLATAALGMAPSVQFSTVNEGDWLMSHGFQPGLGGSNDLNIGWYDHGGGNMGHTAATLPGGVNAESGGSSGAFALGGSVGAGDPQFSQHAHLAMDGSGNLGIPTGAQHDPLYIMPADGGGAGGGSSQDQAQQLGSGLVNGVLQEFGLDGSVFKSFGGSSNPLHFGITKLATGLVNAFAGGGSQQGGSLGGGGGSMLSGLGGLIPHAGSIPVGPGGAQNVRTGETQNTTNHYYGDVGPQLNVTQQGVMSPTQDLHEAANGAANRMPAMGGTNNSGMLPATGTG
jgi:hypothetical protein